MRASKDAELNRLTFEMLRYATRLDDVRWVLHWNMREVRGKDVEVVVDDAANIDAARVLAMDLTTLMRHHRGNADLEAVRIDDTPRTQVGPNDHLAFASTVPGDGDCRTTLCFNIDYYRRPLAAWSEIATASTHLHANMQVLGISHVTLHEVGHMLAAAAAARDPAIMKHQAHETLAAASPEARARIARVAKERYEAEEKQIKEATPEEIMDQLIVKDLDLRKEGKEGVDFGNGDPEALRRRLLEELPDRYYGDGPINEESRIFAEKEISPYAAHSGFEQQGEGLAVVAALGPSADPVSRVTNNRIMDILRMPRDQKIESFLFYRAELACVIAAEQAQRVEFESWPEDVRREQIKQKRDKYADAYQAFLDVLHDRVQLPLGEPDVRAAVSDPTPRSGTPMQRGETDLAPTLGKLIGGARTAGTESQMMAPAREMPAPSLTPPHVTADSRPRTAIGLPKGQLDLPPACLVAPVVGKSSDKQAAPQRPARLQHGARPTRHTELRGPGNGRERGL